MAASRTIDPQAYIDALLAGDESQLVSKAFLPSVLQDDFDNFEEFIKENGQPNPQPADLYLTVERTDFLSMLHYADDNSCLILQNCFGFDQPINKGGQMHLIQKGNMWQRSGVTEAAIIFNTVYKKSKPADMNDPSAPPQEEYELFLNMNPESNLPVDEARHYLENVRSYYPEVMQPDDEFTLGYLFPVKALIKKLEADKLFDGADALTFRWGLTSFSIVSMGNFTIVIGTGDLSTGDVLVFRSGGITGTGANPSPNDCPPHPGCKL